MLQNTNSYLGFESGRSKSPYAGKDEVDLVPLFGRVRWEVCRHDQHLQQRTQHVDVSYLRNWGDSFPFESPGVEYSLDVFLEEYHQLDLFILVAAGLQPTLHESAEGR